MASKSTSSKLLLSDVNQRTEGIGKAAWQLEDTQQDRLVANYPTDPEAREVYFEVAHAEVQYRCALWLLLVLTIFETPAWCNTGETTEHFWTYIAPDDQCTIDKVDQKYVLLSNLPYMPLGWGIIMEVYLIFVMARKLLLELQLQKDYFQPLDVIYMNKKIIYFGLVCVVIELCDSIFFVVYRPAFRVAFISRTGFLCLLPPVQKLAQMIIAVLDQFVSIGCFFLGAALFFSWIVATIFNTVEGEVPGMPGVAKNKGFDTFPHTLNTMLIAGTTDDFVACFIPSYTAFRMSGLLWLLFLVIVQVLLLSLVLDTLVAAYMDYSEKNEEKTTEEKVKGIHAAFTTLTEATGEGEEVTKATFFDFVREFSRSPRTRRIKIATANIIFAAVDEDENPDGTIGSGSLDKTEFCNIAGVMQYEFWTTLKYSFIKFNYPDTWESGWFTKWRNFVETDSCFNFDGLMNGVLCINLVLVVIESSFDLRHLEEPSILGRLELVFALLYVSELCLKLTIWSWGEYWSNFSNKFDFFTTWLLLASSALDELLEGSASGDVKRYMNILRLLRLLRVMKQLRRFPAVTLMVETVYRLVLASKDILTLLGVVVFFFTTLSVQLWGGTLYEGNELLEGTEYEENKHWVLNFNDVPMAMGVWVVSLLCEYVPEFPEAIWKAGGKLSWTWTIFAVFYVFGVSIVFELVKAFTIEIFVTLRNETEKERKAGHKKVQFQALEHLVSIFEEDGLTLHTRIIGDEQLQGKIIEALEKMEHEEKEEEARSLAGNSEHSSPKHGHGDDSPKKH